MIGGTAIIPEEFMEGSFPHDVIYCGHQELTKRVKHGAASVQLFHGAIQWHLKGQSGSSFAQPSGLTKQYRGADFGVSSS